VQFFDGASPIGSAQTLPGSGGGNNKVTLNQTPATGSHTYKAVYTPNIANGFSGSTSSNLPFVAQGAAVGTTTALSANSTTGNGFDPVDLTATVAGTDASHPAGSVAFKEGANMLGTTSTQTPAGSGIYKFTTSALGPGDHTLTAVFTPADPASYTGSTSAPVTIHLNAPACTTCRDQQYIKAQIPVGTLAITTPYDQANPLDLGTLALTPDAHEFTGNAPFNNISITDTRAGSLPWTASAQSSNLTDGGSNPGSTINSQNVGLTNLSVVAVPGNSFDTSAGNLTTTANPAAEPAVGPTDPGTQGLGGASPHQFAHATHGTGSVGFSGTLTLNAPTSTEPGLFTGTVTFTIA
jgi:hypothetical protein